MKQAIVQILLVLAVAGATAASAQAISKEPAYPTKPIRFVVPLVPGGGADIVARTIAKQLREGWKQHVIVDNRPGATGIIGTQLTAKAAPDGYTILMGNTATHAVNVSMFEKLPYHPIRDFTCITLVARLPEMLVVHPSLPVNSAGELIALANAKPGQLTFGSAGVGALSHLTGVQFMQLGGIDLVHVPYKGSAPALSDLMGGQIGMYFGNFLTALPIVRAGKLKALGMTGHKRSLAAPDIPTIAEAGLPGFEAYNWYVVAVPAATPKEIVAALNTNFAAALKNKEVADMLTNDGAEIVASPPNECTRFIDAQIKKYAKVIADGKLRVE